MVLSPNKNLPRGECTFIQIQDMLLLRAAALVAQLSLQIYLS